LPNCTLPLTVKAESVPTLVKLLVTIVDASAVPVKLAAFAVIATLAAAVSCPC
jgi:hypothetical protein